jgi:rod shape-determining protein MreB and related proteins
MLYIKTVYEGDLSLCFTMLISTLYVQISPERLTVRDPKTGAMFSELPEVAIARVPKARIVGIGVEARLQASQPSVEVVNPFAHPRSLVSDFTVAEQLLKAAVRRVKGSGLLSLAPSVVMHPLGEHEGGLTQVEIRALYEMGLGAGARSVKVWQGRSLTDDELLSGTFPPEAGVLLT